MKRLVKSVLKAFWRATNPLRRPFARKFEEYLSRCLKPTEAILSDETTTLMEHVVRELVRLQRQVEYLQHAVEELSAARGDELSVVGEIAPSEKLRAG